MLEGRVYEDDGAAALLEYVLEAPPVIESPPHFRDWWNAAAPHLRVWRKPFGRAVAGGYLADRMGFAFGAGYQAALRQLFPALGDNEAASLAITEEEGNHPRAIHSTLTHVGAGWRLNGKKCWSTLGAESDSVFVAATAGTDAEGRNRIRLARVLLAAPGLQIVQAQAVPFMPEIGHVSLTFNDVEVTDDQLLPGDGYANYVKPFRTIEDIFVNAALLGYLLSVAQRFGWPDAVREQQLAMVMTLRALSAGDPSSPGLHIALGGHFQQIQRMLEAWEPCWALVDESTRAGWRRDSAVLKVAGKARVKRLERAWETMHKTKG